MRKDILMLLHAHQSSAAKLGQCPVLKHPASVDLPRQQLTFVTSICDTQSNLIIVMTLHREMVSFTPTYLQIDKA